MLADSSSNAPQPQATRTHIDVRVVVALGSGQVGPVPREAVQPGRRVCQVVEVAVAFVGRDDRAAGGHHELCVQPRVANRQPAMSSWYVKHISYTNTLVLVDDESCR